MILNVSITAGEDLAPYVSALQRAAEQIRQGAREGEVLNDSGEQIGSFTFVKKDK